MFAREFPGGPGVMTLPSNAAGIGSIPGLGAKIPYASRPKKMKQHKTEAILCHQWFGLIPFLISLLQRSFQFSSQVTLKKKPLP